MIPTRTTPQRDFVLSHRLERVASQLRSLKFNRLGLFAWSLVAVVAAALVWLQRHVPVAAPWIVPVLVVMFVAATAFTVWVVWRDRTGIEDAARHLARLHPELRSALPAAVEQFHEPGGNFHFLQRRVINDALRHADRHDWLIRPRRQARWFFVGHLIALAAALGLAGLVLREHRPIAARRAVLAHGIEITPGDAELERGSSVVVAARFGDSPPGEASLVWQPAGGTATRAPMARSLSDPVFAATLPGLTSDVAYHVEYDGQRSRTFALRVFDLPALTRADASLEFPAYTGLAPRQIVDTRRVSAVVGTRLQYDFYVNKPVTRAVLRTDGSREISLTPVNAERTHFQLKETLSQSEKLTLHLSDDAGRANRVPVDIRIEALENRRPEFKKLFPHGDQQVSPLEEMHLETEVSDDFGLKDYGFGLGIADAAPTYVSLLPPQSAPTTKAAFRHLLTLESHGVKPDQLVTWFAWADDVGPDGAIRRSTSDVFFAQVRRLEEIFREDANGGGRNAPPGGGGPGDELLETQRQISIATWKLRQENSRAPNFTRDATTLRDSQVQAQKQLATLRERLEDDTARAAAAKAAPLMEQAADALGQAVTKKSSAPLDAAWTAARGAYEALLRMQPRDTRVSRSQSGGQGGGNRNQELLNELEFRQENDRYETETQAQPPPTAEQREQLGVLARLRELARRQEDLNRRVQELQTALAAADQEQQDAIRRELKRLEDEQRRLLSDVDETRQRSERLASGEQKQQVQQQLERTREDMRRAGEQLGQGEVSQALAAGSRARETLQRTSEDLRQGNAGRFGDQMREARRQARELSAEQQKATQQLDELSRGQQSLDDSGKREALAQAFQDQAKRRESLLQNLRDITDESEGTEPRLHRQLYDLLRQQGQSGAANQLTTSAELLRRGFVDPVQERQAGLQREFENLQRSVERAAGSVLGDETNELRFAQRELDELTRELGRDRPDSSKPSPSEQSTSANNPGPSDANTPAAGESPGAEQAKSGEKLAKGDASPTGSPTGENSTSPAGTPGDPGQASQPSASGSPTSSAANENAGGQGGRAGGQDDLEQLARAFGTGAGSANDRTTRGPLTGGGFADWAERLRTVEDLIEEPGPRQQIASARFQAEELRRANQREGKAPRWDLVEMGIVAPLQDARAWLRQELNRREEPDALHPIDRDPVPERYAESVRKYYEALGSDSGKPVK